MKKHTLETLASGKSKAPKAGAAKSAIIGLGTLASLSNFPDPKAKGPNTGTVGKSQGSSYKSSKRK